MLLYHSFPGFLGSSRGGSRFSDLRKQNHLFETYLELGTRILLSILQHGFLLTPEDLTAPINPTSLNLFQRRNAAKLRGALNPNEYVTKQRRTCFTLCTLQELLGGIDADEGASQECHADLFGAFSIGVDPIKARELGVSPVNYFYALNDVDMERKSVQFLSTELFYRLLEIRTHFSLLQYMHMKCNGDNIERTHTREILEYAGHPLVEEESCLKAIDALSAREQKKLLALLGSDHAGFLTILDQVDILLSLYQKVDSKKRTPLAYYRQSEWRLPHYVMQVPPAEGTGFLCLGAPSYNYATDRDASRAVAKILYDISSLKGSAYRKEQRPINFRDHFLFRGTAETSLDDVIIEIIVPVEMAQRVHEGLRKASLQRYVPRLKFISYDDASGAFKVVPAAPSQRGSENER